MRQRFLIFSAVIATILFSRSCQNQDSAQLHEQRAGGTVKIGIIGHIERLFPLDTKEYYAREIGQYLLNPALTQPGRNGVAEPDLALGWKISADRRTLTYFLKDNLKWSNGASFNAADVQATFQFIKSNKKYLNKALIPDHISEVARTDSLTIVFTFDRAMANPLRETRFPILNSRQISRFKSWDDAARVFRTEFTGVGPYILGDAGKDSLIFVRNLNYPPPGPYLDTIKIYLYSSADLALKALKDGKLDFMHGFPVSDADKLDQLSHYRILSTPENGFEFIGWNMRNALLKQHKMRRALSLAIDRQTLVDAILNGYAQIHDEPVPPQFYAYLNQPALAYDPPQALRMLSDLGWNEKSGERYLSRDGEILELDLITNSESAIRQEIALNLRAAYQALGIKLNVSILPWDKFMERVENADFDAVLVGWLENRPEDISELFHSDNIASGNNFIGYSDTATDSLLDFLDLTADPDQRLQLWQQFQRRMIEQQALTVLYTKQSISIISEQIRNLEISPFGFLQNIDEWYRIPSDSNNKEARE